MRQTLRLHLAIGLVIASVAGCGSSPAETATAPATSQPDNLPALTASFEAHLNDYLVPEWLPRPITSGQLTDVCIVSPGLAPSPCSELRDAVNGSIVVVLTDTREVAPQFLNSVAYPDRYPIAEYLHGAHVAPVSFGATPDDVDTVVLVASRESETATYSDGTKGYNTTYWVTVVNLEKKTVVGKATFLGAGPPYPAKNVPGDVHAAAPWDQLVIALSCASDPTCD